jgi:hypothetical protein
MKTLRKLREGLKVVAVDTLGKTIPKSKINSLQGAIMKRDIQGTRQDESTMGVGEIDAGLYTKKNTYPRTKTKSAAVGETSNPAFHNPFSSTKSSSTVDKIQKAKTRKINQPGQGMYKKQTPSTRKRVVNNYMKMLKDIGEQTEYTVKHGDTEHTVNDYDHAINKARSILAYGKAKEVYIHTNGNPTHKWQLGKHIEKIKEEVDLDEAVEVQSHHYEFSHGKRPSGEGMWMFTPHKNIDFSKHKEGEHYISVHGKYGEAKKKAQQWAKSKGHRIIKIAEEVELDEAKRPDRPLPKTNLRVGDKVVADTSKEDYPGGHKQRVGVVTRVGEKGVHIKTDDSNEPEWHPHKIVKKQMNELDEAGRCWTGYKPKPGKKAYSPGSCVKEEEVFDQLDERGLDVGHQKRQMSKHFDRYIQAVRAGKFNQARMHYKKYNEHKQTLQKTGHTT